MGRRRIGARLLFGAGASTLIACAAIVGINERIPLEPPDAADDASVEAPPAVDSGQCPADTTCTKVPAGWKLVALQRSRRDPCVLGFGEPRDIDLVESECTCKCTQLSPPRCAGDPVQMRSYPNTNCNGSTATPSYPGDGGCSAGTFNSTIPNGVRLLSFPTAAVCDGGVPSATPLRGGRACAALGPSCSEGICAPSPASNEEERCVLREGNDSCPPSHPTKVRAGSGAKDTRKCGGCTCTSSIPANCGGDELSLFRDGNCTKDPLVVTPACTVLDGGTFQSFRFKSAPLVGCVPALPPPLVDGGVTFEEVVTICCESRDGGP